MPTFASLLSCREVLLASSVALTSFGLLPLVASLYHVRSAPTAAAKLDVWLALTPYDKTAIFVCTLTAMVGVGLLSLNLQVMAITMTRKLVVSFGIGVALLTVVMVMTLSTMTTLPKQETIWKADIFMHREDLFEKRINDVYCHAKGIQVCDYGTVAEAKQIFPLQHWPVGTDTQPGKTIATCCEGFKDSVQLWGYPDKMEVCRLCTTIKQEEQLGSDDVLDVVDQLSFEELQWCGEYLAKRRPDQDVSQSPYHKHREEFQKLLVENQQSPMTLQLGVNTMYVLMGALLTTMGALVRWYWVLKSLSPLCDVQKV